MQCISTDLVFLGIGNLEGGLEYDPWGLIPFIEKTLLISK